MRIFACILLACLACASDGDELGLFQLCVSDCVKDQCVNKEAQLPLNLRLLLWDCESNCDYMCQRAVTADRIARGKEVLQFHGKWPFLRMYGMQEPASVLFSLMNLAAHVQGLLSLKTLTSNKKISESAQYLYYSALIWGVAGINTWIWSAVFHARDTLITERLDYFSAALLMLMSLNYAIVRTFHFYEAGKSSYRKAVFYVIASIYVLHVSYLSYDWSYTYNMQANVAFGIASFMMWLVFTFKETYSILPPPKWSNLPFICSASLIAGASLELFDFPPIADMIDSHSLWHLFTVLPTWAWYQFLYRDISYFDQASKKRRD
ncbi:hypothetical protein CANCADRAFT_89178 [Tortispora caseinolytica NRRL Y-17796]|uniref:Post-GPI attachment to proteins factor 3 n=1 Tax=Tortispora caseinolytica NRRL Y-17796 TaxID=767744 RepID=A0A1E4TLE9_9ASCO|nr:hypothetical protein CANCADRAFT_89178 [Tortispora caseinolytica NRRL Y-17796]